VSVSVDAGGRVSACRCMRSGQFIPDTKDSILTGGRTKGDLPLRVLGWSSGFPLTRNARGRHDPVRCTICRGVSPFSKISSISSVRDHAPWTGNLCGDSLVRPEHVVDRADDRIGKLQSPQTSAAWSFASGQPGSLIHATPCRFQGRGKTAKRHRAGPGLRLCKSGPVSARDWRV